MLFFVAGCVSKSCWSQRLLNFLFDSGLHILPEAELRRNIFVSRGVYSDHIQSGCTRVAEEVTVGMRNYFMQKKRKSPHHHHHHLRQRFHRSTVK